MNAILPHLGTLALNEVKKWLSWGGRKEKKKDGWMGGREKGRGERRMGERYKMIRKQKG